MRALALAVLVVPAAAVADEGMWTFDNFPRERVQADYGFAPDDAWLERVRLGAARTGGCSASFVSAEGLVMTNHHCARRCIEDLSTAGRDLIRDGFLAAAPGEELRCPDERVDQLVAIDDVTAEVAAATKGREGEAFTAALRDTAGRLEKACQRDERTRCQLVDLYRGGRYHLYRYRRWTDVRLVFAPEQAIAFFGGDADNYEYPRWNLDLAFLRVYEDGKPSQSGTHLPWARTGAREGDLIFIAGAPGRTERLLTVAQLEYARDVVLPEQLLLLASQRGFLSEFQRRGDEQRRVAQGKLLSIENQLKRQRGQRRLLVDPGFFAAKVEDERRLRARVDGDPAMKQRYGGAWDAIARAVAAFRPLRGAYVFLEGGPYDGRFVHPKGFDSKLFFIARQIVRRAAERGRPDGARLREMQDASLPAVTREVLTTAPIHPELEIATLAFSLERLREELGPDHPTVRRLLARETPEALAERVVRATRLADLETRRRLWEAGSLQGVKDPMIELAAAVDPEARAVRRKVEETHDAVLAKNGELIARARFEVHGTSIYPDATFTLRLSYGAVRALEEDGRRVPAATTFAGLYQRATGIPPFELPRRWIEARSRLRLDAPFNAIGTPDTVGGNSGSPVIDRHGAIVGLYFDQNVWGTASAFGYDERRRRGVFIHGDGILEALRKVYRADRLVDELTKGRAAPARPRQAPAGR
jgi:hypothetical protein